MPRSGSSKLGKNSYVLVALGFGVALVLLPVCWGFSVDDAWIIRRVAERGLAGQGFGFNPGETTDAVTPLGFAQLSAGLAWLASIDPFLAARTIGATGMLGALGAAAWVGLSGVRGHRERLRRLAAWILCAGLCLPLGAWAGAGLATGLVTALLTLGALALRRRGAWPLIGSLLLGVAAALRPELLPFATTLIALCGSSAPSETVWEGASRTGWRRTLWLLAALAAPSLAVVGIRWQLFGTVIPLSAIAKQPSLQHGLRYAFGGSCLLGPLWLLWPHLFGRGNAARDARREVTPFLMHALAVALAGGDWMPLFRLWVPVLPFALVVGLAQLEHLRAKWLWLALAAAANSALVVAYGRDARAVVVRRSELIEAAQPVLRGSRVIACVDIGWVGAASDARVVDLGGVTDPRVARLPGGHTSKLISPGFFSDRVVDTWVVRSFGQEYSPAKPLDLLQPSYVVDARLLRRLDDLGFVPTAVLPLPASSSQYVVFRYREPAPGRVGR